MGRSGKLYESRSHSDNLSGEKREVVQMQVLFRQRKREEVESCLNPGLIWTGSGVTPAVESE